MTCIYAVFHHFFQHFFSLSWFLFRPDRIFQVHDMTINFSFVLFFIHFSLFFISLLWAMSHVVDGLPAWNISSHMRTVLKGLAFSSRLLVSFLSKGYGSKVFSKNGQFSIDVAQDINQGDFVLLMEKVWPAQCCSKSWCIPNYQLSVSFKTHHFFCLIFEEFEK